MVPFSYIVRVLFLLHRDETNAYKKLDTRPCDAVAPMFGVALCWHAVQHDAPLPKQELASSMGALVQLHAGKV